MSPLEPRGNSRRSIFVVAAALILGIALSTLSARGVLTDPTTQQLLGFLVFWVPWVGAVVLVYRWGAGIPLRFRWIDLLWGVGIGFVARGAATVIELAVYGRIGTLYVGSPGDSSIGATVMFVLTAFAVPLVLGPVIEELFFRGAVLGALRGAGLSGGISAGSITGRRSITGWIAVVASAGVFALMHVLGAATPAAALATGLSTLVFGLGAGTVALTTNRLGGAIVAHVVFNGTVVLLALAG